MAETTLGIMNQQCPDRRIDDEGARNQRGRNIHRTFTLVAARRKLKKLYRSIEC